MAKGNVELIHQCKTDAQRDSCSKLLMQYWRDNGEEEAAKHMEDVFLTEPYNNWTYRAAGVHAVYPSGSTSEVYNRFAKGTKIVNGIVQLNVSKEVFFQKSLPSLLSEARMNRNGYNVVLPDRAPNELVSICRIMKRERDTLVLVQGKMWLVNIGSGVGKCITGERLNRYVEGEAGNDELFGGGSSCPLEKARHMVNTTRGMCRVEVLDTGGVIGDCEDCTKKLQCSGTVFIKNELGKLKPPLRQRFKATQQRKQGRPKKNGLSGLEAGLPPPEPPRDDVASYFERKELKDIKATALELGLSTHRQVSEPEGVVETDKVLKSRLIGELVDLERDGRTSSSSVEPVEVGSLKRPPNATKKRSAASKKKRRTSDGEATSKESSSTTVTHSRSGRAQKPSSVNSRYLYSP